MAEMVGFEPTVRITAQRLSRPLRANGVSRLEDCKIEVQITLAACPRNQFSPACQTFGKQNEGLNGGPVLATFPYRYLFNLWRHDELR